MRVLVGSASRSDLLGSALGHMEDARRMMRMRRLFVVRFQMLMDDGMCDSPRGLGERGQQQRKCHSASGQSDHRRTRYPQPRYAHLSIGGLRLEMRRTAMYSLGLALVSACLFGASTPASKLLLGSFEPFQLAGLLYLGAALGMAPLVGLAHRRVVRCGSIWLYISSAHEIGATRAQGVFAAAPFIGATLSFALLGEPFGLAQAAACALMVASISALVFSQHAHLHAHAELDHVHSDRHDDGHHLHEHPGLAPEVRHSHAHRHARLVHGHPHWPDLHHRHDHIHDPEPVDAGSESSRLRREATKRR
jgi:hypothetical protein